MNPLTKPKYILLLFLIVFILPQIAYASWPVFHANSQHNGLSNEAGPKEGAIKKWTFEGEGLYMLHSPLVGSDGTIYVQKGTGDYMTGNDAIYALTPAGELKWTWSNPEIRFSPIVLSTDGSLVYGLGVNAALSGELGRENAQSILFAVDTATGKLKWERLLSRYYVETWINHIVTDTSGRIYIRGGDVLSAYTRDGERLWTYRTLMGRDYGNPHSTSGPTLSPDEKVVYLLKRIGGGLMAFNADTGKLLWHDKGKYDVDYSSPVVAPDGTIYIPDEKTKSLYAINPDGSRKWKSRGFEGMRLINSVPTVGDDGSIYLTVEERNSQIDGGFLYALDKKDGSIKWSYRLKNGRLSSPPVVDRDGRIYTGTGDGYVFCFSPKGEVIWKLLVGFEVKPGERVEKRRNSMAQIFMSGPVLTDGMLYVIAGEMANKGKLVAVGE